MKTKKKLAADALAAAEAPPQSPGAVWSNNSAACVTTWFSLSKGVLGEIDASFEEAETVTMDQFETLDHSAPPDVLLINCKALARMLTVIFTKKYAARYEPGYDQFTAIDAMSEVMKDPNKTVAILAAVVDETHRFAIGDLS